MFPFPQMMRILDVFGMAEFSFNDLPFLNFVSISISRDVEFSEGIFGGWYMLVYHISQQKMKMTPAANIIRRIGYVVGSFFVQWLQHV